MHSFQFDPNLAEANSWASKWVDDKQIQTNVWRHNWLPLGLDQLLYTHVKFILCWESTYSEVGAKIILKNSVLRTMIFLSPSSVQWFNYILTILNGSSGLKMPFDSSVVSFALYFK